MATYQFVDGRKKGVDGRRRGRTRSDSGVGGKRVAHIAEHVSGRGCGRHERKAAVAVAIMRDITASGSRGWRGNGGTGLSTATDAGTAASRAVLDARPVYHGGPVHVRVVRLALVAQRIERVTQTVLQRLCEIAGEGCVEVHADEGVQFCGKREREGVGGEEAGVEGGEDGVDDEQLGWAVGHGPMAARSTIDGRLYAWRA